MRGEDATKKAPTDQPLTADKINRRKPMGT